MRTLLVSVCAFSLLVAPTRASDTLGQHRAIEKYLDSQTVMVAWVDLSKSNTQDITRLIEDMDGPNIPPPLLSQLKEVQNALLQLDVTKLYWISDLASLPEGPVRLVIPCENPQAVKLLLSAMAEPKLQFDLDGQVLLGGTADGISALKDKQGAPSPELLKAVRACDKDHGVAFATPSNVSMSIMAVLKTEIKKGDASELVKTAEALSGLQSMSLAVSKQPEQLELEMRTKSDAAAVKLQTFIQQFVNQRMKEGADRLAFDVQGETVRYSSNSIGGTMNAVQDLMAVRGSMQSANSLKQVALALHNYADTYRHLPPQSLVDEKGNRLLSWRVLILPYLEEQGLYNKFHLDEPWDSPHNIELAKTIPGPYSTGRISSKNLQEDGLMKTRIVAPMTKDSAFGRPGKPLWFSDFRDGTSKTLWFVETSSDRAVVWTKPEDLPVDTERPMASIVPDGEEGFLGGMVDGSVRFYSSANSDEILNALLTIDGGEVIDYDELK